MEYKDKLLTVMLFFETFLVLRLIYYYNGDNINYCASSPKPDTRY